MILQLYIEVRWVVSQIEGIDLITFLTFFFYFKSCDFDVWMWSEGKDSITVVCYRERFPDFIYLFINYYY